MIRTIAIVLPYFVAVATACSAVADTADTAQKGFWQQDFATSWDEEARENSSASIKFEDRPGRPKKDASTIAVPAPEGEPKGAPKELPPPASRDEIIGRFGDPTRDDGFSPDENASRELKGAAEAFKLGDKELAFHYIRRRIKKQKELNEFVNQVTELEEIALETEGYADPKEEPVLSPERLALKDTIKQIKKERQGRQSVKFDDRLDQLLNAPETDTAALAREAQGPELTDSVPVDPEGRVKVLFFFSGEQSRSKDTVVEVEKAKQLFANDGRVSVIGLVHERLGNPEIEALKNTRGISFPVRLGEALENELQISRLPVLLFVAESSRATYRVEGKSSSQDIEKVIRLMQGGK